MSEPASPAAAASRPRHGGGVAAAARELGRSVAELLDFSASINPLGMPPAVAAAAREAVAAAVHYPDLEGEALREALAAHCGLPAELLLPGAGATELIYLLPRVLACRRALLVLPAFGEYRRSLEQARIGCREFHLDPQRGFSFDPDRFLAAMAPDTDLVIVANPGNPSGAGIDPAALEQVARALAGRGMLVVDEAFADFCPGRSLLAQVPRHDNLYVLRSLTKFYAIPGLRAGFAAGPPGGIARLAAWREPWRLSAPALAAARACLDEAEFRARTRQLVPRWRAELAVGLAGLGLTVFPGEANYLLVRLEPPGTDAASLAGALRREGILVRPCDDFAPLDERYLRLAVRSGEENRRLLAALAVHLPAQRAGGGAR